MSGKPDDPGQRGRALDRLLADVPRHRAPEISLESLIRRVPGVVSLRGLAAAVLLVTGMVLYGVLSRDHTPPVHLPLEVVDIEDPNDPWFDGPSSRYGRPAEEMDRP